jgi:hypothetical protein
MKGMEPRMEQKLDQVIGKLDRLEVKVDRLDDRVSELGVKLDALDVKVSRMDAKFSTEIKALDQKFDRKFDMLQKEMNDGFRAVTRRLDLHEVRFESFEGRLDKLAEAHH